MKREALNSEIMSEELLSTDSPDGKEFLSKDGKVIKNLKQLVKELPLISEQAFKHHVSSSRNDFSDWIKDVFKDVQLSSQIQQIRSQSLMAKTIAARLKSAKTQGIDSSRA